VRIVDEWSRDAERLLDIPITLILQGQAVRKEYNSKNERNYEQAGQNSVQSGNIIGENTQRAIFTFCTGRVTEMRYITLFWGRVKYVLLSWNGTACANIKNP
jgi:hypothetical protein